MSAPLQSGLWVKITAETIEHPVWRDPVGLRLWFLVLAWAKKPPPHIRARIESGELPTGTVHHSYPTLQRELETRVYGLGGTLVQPSLKQIRGALERLDGWGLVSAPTRAQRRSQGRAQKGMLASVNGFTFYGEAFGGRDKKVGQGREQDRVNGSGKQEERESQSKRDTPLTPRTRGDPLLRKYRRGGSPPDGYLSWDTYFGDLALRENCSAEDARDRWTQEREPP